MWIFFPLDHCVFLFTACSTRVFRISFSGSPFLSRTLLTGFLTGFRVGLFSSLVVDLLPCADFFVHLQCTVFLCGCSSFHGFLTGRVSRSDVHRCSAGLISSLFERRDSSSRAFGARIPLFFAVPRRLVTLYSCFCVCAECPSGPHLRLQGGPAGRTPHLLGNPCQQTRFSLIDPPFRSPSFSPPSLWLEGPGGCQGFPATLPRAWLRARGSRLPIPRVGGQGGCQVPPGYHPLAWHRARLSRLPILRMGGRGGCQVTPGYHLPTWRLAQICCLPTLWAGGQGRCRVTLSFFPLTRR